MLLYNIICVYYCDLISYDICMTVVLYVVDGGILYVSNLLCGEGK